MAGIDASLAAGSGISGTVTGPDGTTPLAGIQVTAYRWDGAGWDWIASANTAADGAYWIGGLAAGTYRVRFDDWSSAYHGETYDNAPDLNSGTDVVVGEGVTVAGIDASLLGWSKIRGRVTGPDGATPLSGIRATACLRDEFGWYWVMSDDTDADGVYEIGGLAGGTYRVRFDDVFSGAYRSEAYDNAPDLDSGADLVVLGAGETLAGIDASLADVNSAELAGLQLVGGGGFEIRFTGSANLDYILQEAHSLTGGWSDVGTAATALSGMNTLPGSATASQVFWRIRLVP